MTYRDICRYAPVNETEQAHVDELVKSMLENGWQGMPILVCGEALLTGSHRLAALNEIERMVNDMEIDDAEILDEEIAEDVTEIVEANIAKRE